MNQADEAHKWQYRLFHDLLVCLQKNGLIYAHVGKTEQGRGTIVGLTFPEKPAEEPAEVGQEQTQHERAEEPQTEPEQAEPEPAEKPDAEPEPEPQPAPAPAKRMRKKPAAPTEG